MKRRQTHRTVALALLLSTANLAVWAVAQLPAAPAGFKENIQQAYLWAVAHRMAPASYGMAFQPPSDPASPTGDQP